MIRKCFVMFSRNVYILSVPWWNKDGQSGESLEATCSAPFLSENYRTLLLHWINIKRHNLDFRMAKGKQKKKSNDGCTPRSHLAYTLSVSEFDEHQRFTFIVFCSTHSQLSQQLCQLTFLQKSIISCLALFTLTCLSLTEWWRPKKRKTWCKLQSKRAWGRTRVVGRSDSANHPRNSWNLTQVTKVLPMCSTHNSHEPSWEV